MTFDRYLADKETLFAEQGMMAVWDRLKAFSTATTVGTFVAGATMIGNIDMDAATNPGLTAAVGPGNSNSSRQNYLGSTAGKVLPSSGAVIVTPPTQSR